jgi:dTDP-4-dehydrorhamnose reductase
MLGGSLHRYFSNTENSVVGTVRSNTALEQLADMGFDNVISGIDVTDFEVLDSTISEMKPDYVFNCIGLIKQLSKSKLPVSAIEINSLLPHKIAEICTENDSRLVHFSTDCVFSGDMGSYKESSVPDAIDIYGRSKLLGEVSYDKHLTLRTSIIGHELNSNVSLVDWFLSQTDTVKGFSNAIFSGLPTCYIAEFLEKYVICNPDLSGMYHLSAEPIDKYSLLLLIKNKYDIKVDVIDYPDFIIDRSLNSDSLRDLLNFQPLKWPDLIERMNHEFNEYFR